MVRILVVDDSPVEIKIIRKLLGNQYAIIEALSGKAGIRLAFQERPDLILLDILMPGLDGITVCKELKSDPKTSDIPIIFITAVSEANSVVRGFEAGGQDYITKPFYAPELCARIKVHLDLKKSREMVMSYAETLAEKNKQLHELMDKLEASAMTDFITGLDNRRSMTQKIKAQLEKAQTDNEQAVLIMLDIDDFKHINDSYGHECGDIILQDIAGIMSAAMGQRGVLARWGGEEFLIMLFCAQVTEAQAIAEEIRQSIEICPFCYKQAIISVTATLGIARLDKDQGLDESIRRADDALYQGKKQAKNCVVVMK
jgi:diguanylate cyclase (GGDEF)-like protein